MTDTFSTDPKTCLAEMFQLVAICVTQKKMTPKQVTQLPMDAWMAHAEYAVRVFEQQNIRLVKVQ